MTENVQNGKYSPSPLLPQVVGATQLALCRLGPARRWSGVTRGAGSATVSLVSGG